MKLEKLTPEQEAKMFEIRDFWKDYIFSCKNSVDKDKANASIEWLYEFCGKNKPEVIFVESPLGCQYAASSIKKRANVGANVRANVRANVWANVGANVGDNVRANVWANVGANVWDNVGANVRDNVGDNVRANVWDNVRDNVWDNVRANVRDNVGANVWDNVGANVGANVWANVWDNVRDNVRDNVWDNVRYEPSASYGNIGDYGWVSFYHFFTEIGVLNHKGFNDFKNLLLSGIYDMIQLDGVCIVSNLPDRIHRNSQGRLHCADNSAIHFRDGYEIFYWNGVNIPKEWIMQPDSITKETIVKEGNAEKRRCIMEILGESRYAKLLDLEEIETDSYNGQEIKLLKTKTKDDLAEDYIYFVKVICNSTQREYYLCVPPESAKDAITALSWTFGMTPETYLLDLET